MIDFMLFGGFDSEQTNERTDIGDCRVAFATENVTVDTGGGHMTDGRTKNNWKD